MDIMPFERYYKVAPKLICYLLFILFMGRVMLFILPHRSQAIATYIGDVLGCMILGKRLPDTIKEWWQLTYKCIMLICVKLKLLNLHERFNLLAEIFIIILIFIGCFLY